MLRKITFEIGFDVLYDILDFTVQIQKKNARKKYSKISLIYCKFTQNDENYI